MQINKDLRSCLSARYLNEDFCLSYYDGHFLGEIWTVSSALHDRLF